MRQPQFGQPQYFIEHALDPGDFLGRRIVLVLEESIFVGLLVLPDLFLQILKIDLVVVAETGPALVEGVGVAEVVDVHASAVRGLNGQGIIWRWEELVWIFDGIIICI